MDESQYEYDQEDDDIVDDVLAQAELLDSDEEELPPPKKKRKVNKDGKSKKTKGGDQERTKKRKKKKESSSEEESIEVELTPEEQTAQNISRKELKSLLLKQPDLQVKNTMEICSKVESMPIKEVTSFLEAAKLEMGLKNPLAVAENCVGLVGLTLERWFQKSGLYRRLMQDQQLIAAMDEFAPNFGDNINSPLQVLVRVFGHVSDAHYGQTHFSNVPPNTE